MNVNVLRARVRGLEKELVYQRKDNAKLIMELSRELVRVGNLKDWQQRAKIKLNEAANELSNEGLVGEICELLAEVE